MLKALQMNDPLPLRLGAVVKPPKPAAPSEDRIDAVLWVGDVRDGAVQDSDLPAAQAILGDDMPIRDFATDPLSPWRLWKVEPETAVDTIAVRCEAIIASVYEKKLRHAAMTQDMLGEPFARTETGAPDIPAAIRGGGVLGGVSPTAEEMRSWLYGDFEAPLRVGVDMAKPGSEMTATGMMLRQQYQDGVIRAMRKRFERLELTPIAPFYVGPTEYRLPRSFDGAGAVIGCGCGHCADLRRRYPPQQSRVPLW